MVFSSLFFLYLFLPLCVICYAATKKNRYRNAVLIIFSLIFYAWGEPLCVFILIISAALNYILAFAIDKYRGKLMGKLAVFFAVFFDLAVLGIFKYSGFIAENLNALLPLNLPVPDIKLPIGISFYTFQIISYVIDCHWEKVSVQKSFPKFLMYVSLFPQLVAGPIVRYSTVASELNSRRVTADDFAYGVKRFTAGMCKKVMLANSSGAVASMVLDSTRLTVASSWLGIIMYTFQIYFDFSGYSDMAIGLGRMLGFHFGENFEYPYISRSITEFWRRWHISLSTFFRDYVYIPLGGNRYHAIRNIFIVWLLTGLWHGASWNFIFWGLFYGVLLFIEKTLFKKKLQKIPAPICYIYTMFFIILGWALFYFTDLNALWTFIKSAFGVGTALYDLTAVSTFCTNAWLIAVCVIASTPIPTIIHKNFCKKSKVFAAISEPVLVIVGLGVCFVLLVGQTYNPFLYFRF